MSCFLCRVYEIACSSKTEGTVCFSSKTNIKCFPLYCCPKGCLVPSASVLTKATGLHGWGLSEPTSPTPSTHRQVPCRFHIPAHVAPSQSSRQTPCHRSGLDKPKERKEGAEHEAVTKCWEDFVFSCFQLFIYQHAGEQ